MALNEEVAEEISAVDAIYPGNLSRLSENRVLIRIPNYEEIAIQISFPSNYPAEEPPHILEISISHEKVQRYERSDLQPVCEELMASVYSKGFVCLFDFISELSNVLYERFGAQDDDTEDDELAERMGHLNLDPFDGWIASDPITDRSSTFIAYAAHVNSEEDACLRIDQLKTDNKISKCAHLMTAWRIHGENGVAYKDCDDDGEAAAGSRMLHLLNTMDAWDVVVAVARWFGGVHIGPDRFKHINSCTRDALIKGDFVSQAKAGSASKKTKK
ncbi:AAR055Wp [Eremothecium gossypii ATCC 10895]|uniref:AAR055Wp n=1 Tax=Eremothecium gossypii (strain ATCC 10895 / CBS 109.51 / FGSC 9923 / NRRL Y-1056) TaxID=284811 RepID=Q75EM4_EREGS|nr:AAR055Wp [Eremothecium gossypii ATCC 10895]AAS50420.1 AAR055Wp [Eremothecium gossypii ATCC 10895]AEY94706.1 FAAR055Wp [Eremothecium gossypii FDAG1]